MSRFPTMLKSLLPFFAALPLLLSLSACEGDPQNHHFHLGGGDSSGNIVLPKNDLARLEMPALKKDAAELFIVHRTAPAKTGGDSVLNYAYAYDTSLYHTRWVAFRFDGNTRPRVVARKDHKIRPQYPRDPKLPMRYALADDVGFNGYDHGHICASADRLYSREANDQTFYISNMSPQDPQFNREYWSFLENHVQDLGRDANFSDTLYVVKGGTIYSPNVLRRVASSRVPVPKYYFMALLKVKNGNYTAIGFWMQHKDYGHKGSKARMQQHIVSVSELETLTGINFFHNLPDAVETAVERTAVPSAWKL